MSYYHVSKHVEAFYMYLLIKPHNSLMKYNNTIIIIIFFIDEDTEALTNEVICLRAHI